FQGTSGQITNNTIQDVRNGVQVQPYTVTEGASPSEVSGNTFAVYRLGIYYNYSELGADAWMIQNNSVTVVQPPGIPTGPLGWEGIKAETIRNTGDGGTISNNTVNGTGAVAEESPGWGVHGMR